MRWTIEEEIQLKDYLGNNFGSTHLYKHPSIKNNYLIYLRVTICLKESFPPQVPMYI